MTALGEHRAFLDTILNRQTERRAIFKNDAEYTTQPKLSFGKPGLNTLARQDTEREGEESKENVVNYLKEEETIRNDYTRWYGVSGEMGSNYILGAKDEEICEEYPALKRLMSLKSSLVNTNSHQPLYFPLSPSASNLPSLNPNRFDVILINPPRSYTWEQISNLPIRQISSDPSFVFLLVGSADRDGLERGRECFVKWGFRRAEDIVWVKTNIKSLGSDDDEKNDIVDARDEGSEGKNTTRNRRQATTTTHGAGLFASQKEHCLMGIRGTVRRSVDMRFVHCNVDTDVMLWQDGGDPNSPTFPPYLYTLIENFCLGTRRLEIFGRPTQTRRGWVTAGLEPFPADSSSSEPTSIIDTPEGAVSLFDNTTYPNMMAESDNRPVLPFHPEIDQLRPKSPQRRPRGLPPHSGAGSGVRPPPSQQGFRPQQPQPRFGSSHPTGMRMGNLTSSPFQQYPLQPSFHQKQQQSFHQQQQQQQQMNNPMLAQQMQMMALGAATSNLPMNMNMGMMHPAMAMAMGMDPNMIMAMNMANGGGGGGMGMEGNYGQQQQQQQQNMMGMEGYAQQQNSNMGMGMEGGYGVQGFVPQGMGWQAQAPGQFGQGQVYGGQGQGGWNGGQGQGQGWQW